MNHTWTLSVYPLSLWSGASSLWPIFRNSISDTNPNWRAMSPQMSWHYSRFDVWCRNWPVGIIQQDGVFYPDNLRDAISVLASLFSSVFLTAPSGRIGLALVTVFPKDPMNWSIRSVRREIGAQSRAPLIACWTVLSRIYRGFDKS